MKEQHTAKHNEAEKRYEMEVEGELAIAEYALNGGVITITHTFVPEKLEGRGIASALTHGLLEDIRAKGLQVIPQCQFTAQYIYRHPEYEELVLKEVPTR